MVLLNRTDTPDENRSHGLAGIRLGVLLAYAASLAAIMGYALATEMGQEFLIPRSARRVRYLGLTALLSVAAAVAATWPAWRPRSSPIDPLRLAPRHAKAITASAILLSAA